MAVPISSVPPITPPLAPPAAAGGPSASGGSFHDVLAGAIQTVEATRQSAAAAVEQFLAGEGGELHSTILATERAQLTFDLFLQVRNKVVGAYQEIMRMQM